MRNIKKILSIVILTCNIQFAFPQKVNEVYTPVENHVIENSQLKNPVVVPNYNILNTNSKVRQNQEAIIREQEQHQRTVNALINDAINTIRTNSIAYELPSFSRFPGTEHYRVAYEELEKINNTKTPSLKKAVYVVENAYFENRLSYEKFSGTMNEIAQLCNIKIQDEKGNLDDNLTKNLMLFRFMSDTLEFYDTEREKPVYTYPMKYDFEDYTGESDWTKMFVTKLLLSNTGQCHSMPLLYMIVAQEIGAEAYLSYSPSHSFVKIRDNNNQWYNLELTNGVIISDAAILESGFVKAEAIKNKIYLDTLGIEKVLAQCYVDLAQGYKSKYGYDEFVLTCLDKSLEYFPNNIFALQMKADYLTLQSAYVARQYGKDRFEELRQDSLAVELFNQRNEMYKTIDEIGFEPMPPEKYEAWLKSLNQEKIKTEHEHQFIKLNELKGL